MTADDARQTAEQLAAAATGEDSEAWREGATTLLRLSSRDWLLLDQAARTHTWTGGTPVSGVRGWMGTTLTEPTGFVAAVTSLHADGRFRQRAVQVLAHLAHRATPLAIAALGVRLLDHVAQVRTGAWEGLEPALAAANAELVLDVLLAGGSRTHGSPALEKVTSHLLKSLTPEELVTALTGSRRRLVRRWAFSFGQEQRLLTTGTLLAAARSDPDQWLRRVAAGWLGDTAAPRQLVALLDAGSVEARLVAVGRLPDADLSASALQALLMDRAPRVRRDAQTRARRRGVDIAACYRRAVAAGGTPRTVAAALDGLASAGQASDVAAFVAELGNPSARVRAAAVGALAARGDADDVTEVIAALLLDPAPRASTAAARALARLGASPTIAQPAWNSPQVFSRRAAWMLTRARGGWDRVEADLRASCDAEPELASLGHAGVRNWLDVSAATTWQRLPENQRERIRLLLPVSGLTSKQQREVAFHAGVPRDDSSLQQAPLRQAADVGFSAKPTWWRRVTRRT